MLSASGEWRAIVERGVRELCKVPGVAVHRHLHTDVPTSLPATPEDYECAVVAKVSSPPSTRMALTNNE